MVERRVSKEEFARTQARRELKNKIRKINRLEKANQPVPTVLFERITELQQRLIK